MTSSTHSTIPPAEPHQSASPPKTLTEIEQRHIAMFDLIDSFETSAGILFPDGSAADEYMTIWRFIADEIGQLEIQAIALSPTTPLERLFQLQLIFCLMEGQGNDDTIYPSFRAQAHRLCGAILAEAREICSDLGIPFASLHWIPPTEP